MHNLKTSWQQNIIFYARRYSIFRRLATLVRARKCCWCIVFYGSIIILKRDIVSPYIVEKKKEELLQ